MNFTTDEFYNQLQAAVEEDRLLLPSLPEVALKIRDVVDDEDTTINQVVDILSQDASMSARLLKTVNSPLYRARDPIDDLHMAVSRMGLKLVRDLVVNLAMKQMYQPTSAIMEQQFRNAWGTSVDVAAICHMMAVTFGMRKEQALLAGLIHNIGSLPILLLAENDDDLFNDQAALTSLISSLQGRVGAMILTKWNFSTDLIEVVNRCNDFTYDHEGGANLVDLVQFALLQGGFIDDKQAPEDWSLIPAFAKLGMDVEVDVIHLEENEVLLDEAKQSLMA